MSVPPAGPQPPFEGFSPKDKDSFSYETVVKRWPVILTGIIDDLHNAVSALYPSAPSPPLGPPSPTSVPPSSPANSAKILEGKDLIGHLDKLKYEMARDRPLGSVPDDGGLDVAGYNADLERLAEEGKGSWFSAPWLYAECYLYRLMRAWFALTTHWKEYDPFVKQKLATFQASGNAVFKLAVTMAEMDAKRAVLDHDEAQLQVLFDEMIQMCLWGNATDLSLLPTMDYSQIQKLQSVGKAAQAASAQFILVNDLVKVWEHLKGLSAGRVDIILDNSGFELFTDLVLADFLVTHTPYVSSIVFHPKLLPWFVSDVLPPDFNFLLSPPTSAGDGAPSWASFFASSYASPSPEEISALDTMIARWRSYVASGVFKLSVPLGTALGVPAPAGAEGTVSDKTSLVEGEELEEPGLSDARDAAFWTTQYSYWRLPEQKGLLSNLKGSGLVVFKGDLNYRKLTADAKWPSTTPFSEAIGPLHGEFPLLSLRTCKADVVVGLPEGVAERLDGDAKEKSWRVNGKYGLICFDGGINNN